MLPSVPIPSSVFPKNLSDPNLIPIGERCPAKNGKTSESLTNKSEPKPTSPYKLKFSLLKYTNRYFP